MTIYIYYHIIIKLFIIYYYIFIMLQMFKNNSGQIRYNIMSVFKKCYSHYRMSYYYFLSNVKM